MSVARNLAITITAALLGACGQAMDQVTELGIQHDPTLVIRPGYKIDIDGKPTEISGDDDCPRNSGALIPEYFFIGGTPIDGTRHCVILAKDRSEVVVTLIAPDQHVQTEHWSIVRWVHEKDGHRFQGTGLRRPDGTAVNPATHS